MHFKFLPITIYLYLLLNQILCSVATTNSPVIYHPLDNIAVNCGSSGNSTAVDDRRWTGDIGSNYTPLLHSKNGKLLSSKATNQPLFPDKVPYTTAWLSRWPFTYTFRVTPGPKFIRLHFYPASYRGGFKQSKAFFTVKAGPYTLLSNFSASLTVNDLGLKSLVKEYCVNLKENQPLILTFSPSLGGSSDEAYAFVNGIEIVSMPAGLYHTQEGDAGAYSVGENFRFPIGKSIALEMVQRLNVGGTSISSIEDTGMFRQWSQDSNSLLENSSFQPVTTTLQIKYISIPSYTAPPIVYQTSRSLVLVKQANDSLNFTWKVPVDLGFRYLLRLHFCEFDYEIRESGQMEFSIFVNEHMAEAKAEIMKWSGGSGVAVYMDYVMMMEGDRMEGKHDMLIALCAHRSHNQDRARTPDAILKGLEVFKLSNPDKNLAGVNPVPLGRTSTSNNDNQRKFVFASSGNAIGAVIVTLLTTLNIVVYQLRVLGEKFGEKNISSSPFEGLCRRFSLSQVLSATNNFDDELVIGSGGFGYVYKALIDDGTTTVAIKRLNTKSRQGANEFWTEIEMLSNLRHPHLVSLIGYCDERQEMILVYEYMEHGTLADHLYKLYNLDNGIICHLSWEQRMRICIGTARGLDYLHTGTQRCIIHRDVKTSNILLDKDWVAKISDFGLCKVGTTSHSHTYVSTDVKGTFGYLDPEYFSTYRLTKKSDVYAFGVVLLEVLCGRPAVDIRLEEEQRSLALWAQHCIQEEKFDQLIDPSLRDQISHECLKVFTEVANKCLHKHPSGRPIITNVVASLECMLASQKQPMNACIEDGEAKEDVNVDKNGQQNDVLPQEEDVNVDKNTQQNDVLPQEEDANVDKNTQQHDNDVLPQEDDVNVDKNIHQNDVLPRGTVASPSPPVQFKENTQRPKRSKKNLFQRGISFLARGIDISSMGIPDVDIRTTTINELISQGISPTTNTNPSDESKISRNRQFSGLSDTNVACPDGRILPIPNLRIYSFSELQNATRNFNCDALLGKGRFGQVYRGRLDDKVTSNNGSGFVVAVKKLDYQMDDRFRYWQSEVGFMGGLSHSNLVKLLGYSWDDEELLLVFEFMPKGSLENHLFGRGSAVQPLPWDIRLKILIGAARGLAFLHSLKRPVICREFSASNILLDGSFNSKISDFRYALLDSPESFYPYEYLPTWLCYEPYVAPEYIATGHLNVKSDVYSFGVVLLEMLTGLCARDTNQLHWQRNLVDWVKPYLVDRRKLATVMDSGLEGEYPPKAAWRLAHLARQCLGYDPKRRPSMEQVVETLERINLLRRSNTR